MKKVFITGATGFVGSHLVPAFNSDGWKVCAAVRKKTGRVRNIGQTGDNCDEIVIEDINSYSSWEESLNGIDVVVHLAGLAHDSSDGDGSWTPHDYRQTNMAATVRIAEAAALAKVKRLIFISTVKVHGDDSQMDHPINELSRCNPCDSYSSSKLEAEKALRSISERRGLEVVIIRPPLVYGPGVKGNMNKLTAAISQKLLVPAPSIDNRRSFIYVGNLVNFIMVCAEHPDASGETFIPSDGEDVSTMELMRRISKNRSSWHAIVPVPETIFNTAGKVGDVAQKIMRRPFAINSHAISKLQASLTVDPAKTRKTLGWKPPFTMEEGLYEMIGANGGMGNGSATLEVKIAPAIGATAHSKTNGAVNKGADTPALSVIVVNYNAGELLSRCISSTLRSSLSLEVIVADNGSTDGSIERLRKVLGDDPRVRIIENKANLGFARANNRALSLASGKYLLLLNPDCIVEPATFHKVLSHLESNAEAAMAGCLIRNEDGSEQAGCRRMVPTPWRFFAAATRLDRLFPNRPRFRNFALTNQPIPDSPIYIEALSGAFMFIRREALEQVGLLDEKYFIHCEDLDWCMRFRKAGWKIMFVPDAQITHIKGSCSHNYPFRILWHKHKGMVRFYRKHFKHQYPFPLMWIVIISIWARFAFLAANTFLRQVFSVKSEPEKALNSG